MKVLQELVSHATNGAVWDRTSPPELWGETAAGSGSNRNRTAGFVSHLLTPSAGSGPEAHHGPRETLGRGYLFFGVRLSLLSDKKMTVLRRQENGSDAVGSRSPSAAHRHEVGEALGQEPLVVLVLDMQDGMACSSTTASSQGPALSECRPPPSPGPGMIAW